MNVFHDIELSAIGDLHFFERVWFWSGLVWPKEWTKIYSVRRSLKWWRIAWLRLGRRALLRDRWSRYMLERRSLLGCLPEPWKTKLLERRAGSRASRRVAR